MQLAINPTEEKWNNVLSAILSISDSTLSDKTDVNAEIEKKKERRKKNYEKT